MIELKKNMKIDIAITTTSMGNGHIMKAMSIKEAFGRISALLKKEKIAAHASVIDERISLSPLARQIKKLVEWMYDFMSSSKHIKKWWDRKIQDPEGSSVEFIESIIRAINRVSGGKCIKKDKINGFDAVISTHPSDRVAIFPEGTVFIRVNPDIFCHTFHMIPIRGMDEWHVVASEKLRKRIIEGKEKFLMEQFIPKDKNRLLFLGAFAHPKNIDALYQNKFWKMVQMKKAPVMFQIGGAGAQQELFLELMAHIDYEAISPLFAAGWNKKFFMRLLDKGMKIKKITKKEYLAAVSGDFRELKYEKGIMRFSSGLSILYHEERYKAIEYLDMAKSENLINVIKPGDVTSAGTLLYFLYYIGSHEIENAKWAIGRGFAEWLIPIDEYEKLRESSGQKELDIEYGKKASDAINKAAIDKKHIMEQIENLKKTDNYGSYNIACLAIFISIWRKYSDRALIISIHKLLADKNMCTIKKEIIEYITEQA